MSSGVTMSGPCQNPLFRAPTRIGLDPKSNRRETLTVPAPQERRPEETAKAFAAFVEYLRLGPQRSQEQAAANLRKSVGTLRKWAERHGWVARAAEYDALCVEQEMAVQEVLRKSRAVDWVKRQDALKEAEWDIAERCIAKARELLGRPDVKWSGGDIAKLLDVASKLARLATGMETDRRELTGKDGGPVKVEVDVAPLIKRVYGASAASVEEPKAIEVPSEARQLEDPGAWYRKKAGAPEGTPAAVSDDRSGNDTADTEAR